MAPNREEEHKIMEYKDDDSGFELGPAEKFLKSLLDIPFSFKRVEAMLYMANFESEVNFLKNSFETLEIQEEESGKYKSHFSEYIKRRIEPDNMEEMHSRVHAAIQ